MVSCRYFVFKWFVVNVFDFQMKLRCRNFGTFGLGNCFGNFFQKWVLFQPSGHTVSSMQGQEIELASPPFSAC